MWSMPQSTNADNSARGFVSLIGAGPGDPGLITLRALDRIRQCEAIVYDRLIPFQLLEEAPSTAERIDVGKHPGSPKVPQEEIQKILVRKAKEGMHVVRLKGGDPGMFGRAGEEVAALQDAGVAFEIIPGITAGIAAAAAAGIPLTHRNIASSVTFVTGHEDPTKTNAHLDWDQLAKAGTLVFYMIGKHLSEISERLIAMGRPASTPAMIVREATHPTEHMTQTTLGDLRNHHENFRPGYPAVLIVGEVGRIRECSRAHLPLQNKTIILTHPAEISDPLRTHLVQWGARVILCPSIQIRPMKDLSPLKSAFERMDHYHWILFTSKNAVRVVRDHFAAEGWDTRHFGNTRIASVGRSTARHLEEWGIVPDLIPPKSTAADLFAHLMKTQKIQGQRFLFPCSEIARGDLGELIVEAGGEFDRIPCYRTSTSSVEWNLTQPLEDLMIDGVSFTSSSTVRGFRERVGEQSFNRLVTRSKIFSIGPKTSETLQQLGPENIHESGESDFEGLANLILNTLSMEKS